MRTDYRFESLEEAVELSTFFFGEEMGQTSPRELDTFRAQSCPNARASGGEKPDGNFIVGRRSGVWRRNARTGLTRAIEMAGGTHVSIRIIPTAAAPDKNHLRAGNNGIRWFRSLGATNVEPVLLINKESADDFEIAGTLRAAKLIYMLGRIHPLSWANAERQPGLGFGVGGLQDGAVIAGSSAGAMVMCEYYFDPGRSKVEQGLNLVPNACVLPHHNTFGKDWAGKVGALLPGVTLLGIDEYTGMLTGGAAWQVLGGGAVTVYDGDEVNVYERGQRFVFNEPLRRTTLAPPARAGEGTKLLCFFFVCLASFAVKNRKQP